MVSDIPSWLRDGRLTDLEIQNAAQSFIFTRVELYASSMLLLQYSVPPVEAKSSLSYGGVNEVLLVILMVKSPKVFRDYDQKCDKSAEDETLAGIRTEIYKMSQDKEVQNMLTQEMFDRMDRESYREQCIEEGLAQGLEKGLAEGLEKGFAEGMEKGLAQGESKLADLVGKLLSAGRIEDAQRASADPVYRKKLYEELQIQ